MHYETVRGTYKKIAAGAGKAYKSLAERKWGAHRGTCVFTERSQKILHDRVNRLLRDSKLTLNVIED